MLCYSVTLRISCSLLLKHPRAQKHLPCRPVSIFQSNRFFIEFAVDAFANGGLKKDPFKGAEYNYLNLPYEITVTAIMGKINYQYAADGRKYDLRNRKTKKH
jgi:hypothetical protein